MKRALLVLGALVLLNVGIGVAKADHARGIADRMPWIQVENPSEGVAVITYGNLPPADFAALFQNGYDTVHPNTGRIEVDYGLPQGRYVTFKVCTAGPTQNVCTPNDTEYVR